MSDYATMHGIVSAACIAWAKRENDRCYSSIR